jgi:protein-S-isoprenylcysteine O-methyltransferase Ste14
VVAWLALVGLLTWLSFELVLRQGGESRRVSGPGDVSRSTQVLLVSYAVVLAIVVACSILQLLPIPIGFRWLGCALLVAGLALRAWAMILLRNSYSRGLQVSEGQRLVTTGPYRVVRHPGYAGSLLVWVGFALGLGSWVATILAAVLLGAAYAYRISAEERMLRAEFGRAYGDYQRATWRLIPGLF